MFGVSGGCIFRLYTVEGAVFMPLKCEKAVIRVRSAWADPNLHYFS